MVSGVHLAACASIVMVVTAGSGEAKTSSTKVDTILIFSPEWQSYEDARIKSQTDPSFAATVASKDAAFNNFIWAGLEHYKDKAQNSRLMAECAEPPSSPNGAFLGLLVAPLISLFTDHIKSSLDDELKKYAAEVKASGRQSFYVVGAEGGPLQTSRCFRITRLRTELGTAAAGKPATASRTVEFDFIGQLAIIGPDGALAGDSKSTAAGWGVKVRPLRVFLRRPLSKGSEVAMAGTISMDAVWRFGEEGKRAMIFSAPVLERKFKRDATGTWMARPELVPNVNADGVNDQTNFPDWAQLPLQPMIPWSTQVGPDATEVTATFHATEVGEGDGKGALKVVKKIFDKAQPDINSTIAAAAKKLIEPSAPPATPDLYCGTFTSSSDGTGTISWQKSATPCAATPAS